MDTLITKFVTHPLTDQSHLIVKRKKNLH